MNKFLAAAFISMSLVIPVSTISGCVTTPVEQTEVGSYSVQLAKVRSLGASIEETTLQLRKRERISHERARSIHTAMTQVYKDLDVLELLPNQGDLDKVEEALIQLELRLKEEDNG